MDTQQGSKQQIMGKENCLTHCYSLGLEGSRSWGLSVPAGNLAAPLASTHEGTEHFHPKVWGQNTVTPAGLRLLSSGQPLARQALAGVWGLGLLEASQHSPNGESGSLGLSCDMHLARHPLSSWESGIVAPARQGVST